MLKGKNKFMIYIPFYPAFINDSVFALYLEGKSTSTIILLGIWMILKL